MRDPAWTLTPGLRAVRTNTLGISQQCDARQAPACANRAILSAKSHGDRAIAAVKSSYEDDKEGAMAYQRWCAARDEAQETGLGAELGAAAVYGDVDLGLLLRALDTAGVRERDRVVDIGSGYGRAVYAAACAYDGDGERGRVACVTGIEIMPLLHGYAVEKLEIMRAAWPGMAEVNFLHSDYRSCERAAQAIREADCLFVFATTWPEQAGGVASELAGRLFECAQIGATIVLVDALLPDDARDGVLFTPVTSFEAENAATGVSKVSLYRVE